MNKPEINEPGKLALFFSALWDLIHRNWGYKLLALLLAVILWAGLITQDPNLTRQKVMEGGVIEVQGTTVYNTYIITAGLDSLPEVTITADVPQLSYQKASAADYAPYIDLRTITGEGVQELAINTRAGKDTGTVVKLQPETVTVTVDRYVTLRGFQINPVAEGSLPGWYLSNLRTGGDSTVNIAGPASVVSDIRVVEAVLDLNELTDDRGELREDLRDKKLNWPIRLVRRDGTVYTSDMLEELQVRVTYGTQTGVTSIPLTYTMMRRATLPLVMEEVCVGTPAEGYAVAKVDMPRITVAGNQSDVEAITSYRLAEPVDITGCRETVRVSATAVIDSDANLIWIDGEGLPVEGDSHKVDITVVIQPEIPVTPALTGALPAGWRLEGEPVCSPAVVTLLNGASAIDRMEVLLDLSALTIPEDGVLSVPVEVEPPFTSVRFLDNGGSEIPPAGSQMEVRSEGSHQSAVRVTLTAVPVPAAESAEPEAKASEPAQVLAQGSVEAE